MPSPQQQPDTNGRLHTMADGESFAAVAVAAGLDAVTVWNHPENAKLRERRPVPLHLVAGDQVFLPALAPKFLPVDTNARHVFKRRSIPAKYRAQLFSAKGDVRASQNYSLTIDGVPQEGRTDAAGILEIFLPPGARQGMLRMHEDGWTLKLNFATLAPAGTIIGAQMRLANMGYFDGHADGVVNETCRRALVRFQVAAALPVTSEFDEPTLVAIAEHHDRKTGRLPRALKP